MADFLTHADIKRLRNTMAHVRDDSFFLRFKRLLRAKLRFDTFLIFVFDPIGAPRMLEGWLRRDTIPPELLTQYVEGAYRLDPFFQFSDLPKDGGLYRLSDIAPDRFFSSEYYLQYYEQTRLCDEIGLLAPYGSGSIAHLSFSRLDQGGPFKRKELQCLQLYSPLILELLAGHCTYRSAANIPAQASYPPRPLHDIISEQVAQNLAVKLTPRETQIAALVLQGHSNASAALTLGISYETSKVHRRNTYRKLNISSQGELFALLKDLL